MQRLTKKNCHLVSCLSYCSVIFKGLLAIKCRRWLIWRTASLNNNFLTGYEAFGSNVLHMLYFFESISNKQNCILINLSYGNINAFLVGNEYSFNRLIKNWQYSDDLLSDGLLNKVVNIICKMKDFPSLRFEDKKNNEILFESKSLSSPGLESTEKSFKIVGWTLTGFQNSSQLRVFLLSAIFVKRFCNPIIFITLLETCKFNMVRTILYSLFLSFRGEYFISWKFDCDDEAISTVMLLKI